MRKTKTVAKTNLVRLSGYGPDWWHYPPEWDAQMKKLQEEADKTNQNEIRK